MIAIKQMQENHHNEDYPFDKRTFIFRYAHDKI